MNTRDDDAARILIEAGFTVDELLALQDRLAVARLSILAGERAEAVPVGDLEGAKRAAFLRVLELMSQKDDD